MTCTTDQHNRTTYARGTCRCPAGRNDRRIYLKRRREGRAVQVRIPVLGYQRKIHALIAVGWSYRLIGEQADMAHQEIRRVSGERVHRTRKPIKWVSEATAVRINRAWANLSDEDGPSVRSVMHARKMDWAPPWAWDGCNMDDPRARPNLDLPPVIDEVLIQRVMDGKSPYRDLNPDERLAAYRACVDAGWTPTRIQHTFHISGAMHNGLKKAA